MSYLRFNHVFFALMATALVSAFVFSTRATDRVKSQVANLFAPVAWPVNRVAGWARERMSHETPRDDGAPHGSRSNAEVVRENTELRIAYMNIKGQLQKMLEREAEKQLLGEISELCTRFTVTGADSAGRDSLLLSGSSVDGLREGMPVLYSRGIVGRIIRTGLGEARVLLITDPQSRMVVNFARFNRKPDGSIDSQILSAEGPLLEGAGNGELIIRNVSYKTVDEIKLRPDDWVVLNDRDWPPGLNYYRVGTVYSIENSKNPGFVIIRARPDSKLIELREVMVMNKGKG
ncbi:MAG TPA: rod shape-determining protein MreC [Tepidisphaeraceae bacterium]|jgi:cell shape-determining protein MreC